MEKWTIAKIKQANEAAGHNDFEWYAKHKTTLPKVYQGRGGVYFIVHDRRPEWSPCFFVWQFNRGDRSIHCYSCGQPTVDIAVAIAQQAAGE